MLILIIAIPFAFCCGLLIQRAGHLGKTLRTTQAQLSETQRSLEEAHAQLREAELHCARLQEERRAAAAQSAELDEAQERLHHAFKALSAEALQMNNQAFLDLARLKLEQFQQLARTDLDRRQEAIGELVKPVRESLDKFEGKLSDLERLRSEGTATLKAQISSLAVLQADLNRETSRLASALKTTTVRGRWGEIQLRRVVELAGMVAHCDFYEQETVESEGNRRRPDLIVRLPAQRVIVVDAKVPLDAYLQASEAESEEERQALLKRHAEQIRLHMRSLAGKGYAHHFAPNPEFVVLFLPGDLFFSAALSQDPTLIELGAELGVILATPTTLISLLRAVSYGWKQEALSQNAQKVSELGAELYRRLSTVASHWARLGKQLTGAVQAFNDSIGSLEHRVLSTAREFERLGAVKGSPDLPLLTPIDQLPRDIQKPELLGTSP
jgi:DNA recombination protein RmuC